MEQTWLTFHCWLYTLYIIVYVTNLELELDLLKVAIYLISFLFDFSFLSFILYVYDDNNLSHLTRGIFFTRVSGISLFEHVVQRCVLLADQKIKKN